VDVRRPGVTQDVRTEILDVFEVPRESVDFVDNNVRNAPVTGQAEVASIGLRLVDGR